MIGKLSSLLKIVFVSGAVIATAAGYLAAQSTAEADERRVVSERVDTCLNLRSQPTLSSPRVLCLERGTIVDVLAERDGWSQIRLEEGSVGWSAHRFLDPMPLTEESEQVAPEPVSPAETEPVDEGSVPGADKVFVPLEPLSAAEGMEVEETKEDRDQSQAELIFLQTQLDSLQQERARLVRALENNGNDSVGMGEDFGAVVAERDRLRADRDAVTTELEDFRQRLESSESARVKLEQELGGLRASMEDAQGRLAAAEERAHRAESELGSQQSDASSMNAALEDSRQRLESSESVRVELEQELGGLRASLDDAQVRLAAAEESAKRVKSELVAEVVDTTAAADADSVPRSGEPVSRDLPVEAETVGPMADVEAAVLAWADAWSRQDVEAYLGSYSQVFTPQYGASRSTWERQRRERLAQPAFIEITITELEIEVGEDGRATATFSQSYASDTFSDVVSKSLVLVSGPDGWKIESEEAASP
jgi:uncharacterized protein YgiM (DUF1202 family)